MHCTFLKAALLRYVCIPLLGTILQSVYRMAGNFGGNLFWRLAEISVFGGIYFGGLAKPVP